MAKTSTKTFGTAGNPDIYIEEFLFRGRRKDDDRPTGWHVILGLEGSDPLGRPYPPMAMMNSAQAVEAGWDVPQILAEINSEVMAELEQERTKTAKLQDDADLKASELLAAKAEIEDLKNQAIAVAKAAEMEAERIRAEKEASDAAAAEKGMAMAQPAGEVS